MLFNNFWIIFTALEKTVYDSSQDHDTVVYTIGAPAMYRVGQKSKPYNFCNNFIYCQPIFIIFGTYTL